jgi:hypothetical protein
MAKLLAQSDQSFGSSHAMRNELALSSEVASDETLLYRWLRHEGGSSCRALVGYRRREIMGVKSTHDSCPPDSLRGRCCLLKKSLLCWPFLRGREAFEKSGNTRHTDMHTRWSQAGRASPTGLANESSGANERPWADEEEVLSQAASEAMEAPPHIVAESRAVHLRRSALPSFSMCSLHQAHCERQGDREP